MTGQRRSWLLVGLMWLVGAAILLGAYQLQPFSTSLEVGTVRARSYLAHFYDPEKAGDRTYRWSQDRSYVSLPPVGTPYELSFEASQANPQHDQVAVIVSANGQTLGQVQVGHSITKFTLRSSRPDFGPGDLNLTFQIEQTFAEPGGRPKLGIALYGISLSPYRNRIGLIVPPPFQVGWWLLVAAWPVMLLRLLRLNLPRLRPYWLALVNLGVVSVWLALPGGSEYLHLNWFEAGVQIALIETGLALGWLLVGRWRRQEWQLRDPRRGLLLLLLALALLYLGTARGFNQYRDDLVMQAETAAIVQGNPIQPVTPFLPTLQPPLGQTYSKYGIGLSLVGVPLYVLGNGLAAAMPYMASQENGSFGLNIYVLLLTEMLVTVGAVGLFYWLLRLVKIGPRAAVVTAALYGVGTMAWHYARTFMSEPLVGFGLLLTLTTALKYGQTRQTRWALLSGFGLGLTIATRSSNLTLVPLVGLYLLWVWWDEAGRPRRWPDRTTLIGLVRDAGGWLLGLGVWLALVGWYNWARFGSPLETGYEAGFTGSFWEGFGGLVFSTGKGLFAYNPVLLLGLVGLGTALRRQRALTLLSLSFVAAFLGVYSFWYDWDGGGVWGPRFLLPIVPVLLWPAAYIFTFLDRPATRGFKPDWRWLAGMSLVGFVVGASLLVQVLSIVINFQPYLGEINHDPALAARYLYTPFDSPIAAHWRQWQLGGRPDLASAFYFETPLARLVRWMEGVGWKVSLGLAGLVAALWLRPVKVVENPPPVTTPQELQTAP